MIALTESAAKEIRKIKSEQGLGDEVPIRIGIKAGGCSGFTYTFTFDSSKGKFDLEFESHGLRILVDKKSHIYIDGTLVDWNYSLVDRGLKFTNPSAKGSCGCGTSFLYEPKNDSQTVPVFQLKL